MDGICHQTAQAQRALSLQRHKHAGIGVLQLVEYCSHAKGEAVQALGSLLQVVERLD